MRLISAGPGRGSAGSGGGGDWASLGSGEGGLGGPTGGPPPSPAAAVAPAGDPLQPPGADRGLRFSDESVDDVAWSRLPRSKVYMLFYEPKPGTATLDVIRALESV